MTTVIAYCLDWHVRVSPAFRDLLVDPLKPFVDVQLNAWDGVSAPEGGWQRPADGLPLIFCQLPPPPELLTDTRARLVWIPMWDHARGYAPEWWAKLPRSLRVVAFSQVVAQHAQAAGLPTLRLGYYLDPSATEAASWDGERVLMYWNRTGLISSVFLNRLCAILHADRLLFLSQLDPGIPPHAGYHPPKQLGRTVVQEFKFLPRQDYLRLLGQANVYIAPRASEGVGIAVLEALARGCAVLAYDAPTMNEYITSGTDGYLFASRVARWDVGRLARSLSYRLRGLALSQPAFPFVLHEQFPPCALAQLDLEDLGRHARQRHSIGFASWQKQIADYARFVLEW